MENNSTKLQIDMAEVRKDIEYIKEKQDITSAQLTALIEEIKKMDDAMENRFANKWVESALVWLGSAIGLAIVGGVMKLIIK